MISGYLFCQVSQWMRTVRNALRNRVTEPFRSDDLTFIDVSNNESRSKANDSTSWSQYGVLVKNGLTLTHVEYKEQHQSRRTNWFAGAIVLVNG